MQYQIVTFGNGEILKGVLDAIAMCMNSTTGTLYEPLMRISLIFGVFWAALYSIWGDYLRAWGRATLPFILIPPLLFVPTARVHIHDVVSHYRDHVDHVPYGLACVTHFISQIGYEVTKQVDRVFADVEDLKYHKSGFLMASNLIQEARTFQITHEDLAENMRQFACQCIAYDAMLGYKYTFEDLKNTDDIWGLVSARPSPLRAFVWRQPRKPNEPGSMPEIITCREGVKRFNALWGAELEKSKDVLGTKLFGHTNPLTSKTEFLKYLPVSYGFLTGISKNADEILKQQMMIHSIVDGLERKSEALGNAPNFAARKAYLQQRTTYETLGAMASQSLITMKAALEALVYAAFIFLVPLAVLPFGWKILLSWVQTLLWLQMWAPLYAVLNFIMSKYASSKSIAMLSLSNPDGVTLASSVGLMNLNADIAAIAGFLSLSVPFIAIALVKGVGSFVHMASHLGGVAQGAAAQAAGDAVSGNYSFGNISEGNIQMANTNMLAMSRAASYRAGSFQFADGRSEITTMGDGSQIANVGVSNLPVALNVAESMTAQQSEMAARNYQKGLNFSESSAQHLSSSYRNLVSLSDNLGRSESMNDSMSQGVSAEQSRNIHRSAQVIRDFADSNNISVEKAANLFAEASVGGGILVKGAVGGKASLSAVDSQLLQKAEKYINDHSFQEAVRQSSQAASTLSHSLSDEQSRRLAQDVSGSFEKGINERAEASKSFSEAESFSQQAMNTQANSASINANYTQQYIEWLARQPRDNTNGGTIGMRGAIDIVARVPQEAEAYGRQFMREQGLVPSETLHTNPSHLKSGYYAETNHKLYKANNDSLNEVKEQGSTAFNNDVSRRGEGLRQESSQTMDATNQSIAQGVSGVTQEGSKIKKKVKDQEGRSVIVKVGDKFDAEVYKTIHGESQQK